MSLSSLTQNPKKITYEGEDKDENIVYVVRSSIYTLLPSIFPIIVFCLIPFVLTPILRGFTENGTNLLPLGIIFLIDAFIYLFAFGYFFHTFLNWYFNVLIISNKKIIDVDFKGLTYKNVSETTIDHVEDVTSTISGTIGMLLNIGDIKIQTAAEQREFEFYGVEDPSKIRDMIADFAAKIRESKHK